jgi:hypothetical protein
MRTKPKPKPKPRKTAKNPVGRPPEIKTPAMLWDLFLQYIEYNKANPFYVNDFKGNPPESVEIRKDKPLTIVGFEDFLGVGIKWFEQFKGSDTVKNNPEFSSIITRVEASCYNHKFSGAAAGIFNANIIARDLGLADKRDIHNTIEADADEIKKLFPFAAPND